MSDDNLVYDSELGWIDPSDILGSLGVEVLSCHESVFYCIGDVAILGVPNIGDLDRLAVLQACLDDARAKCRQAT